MRRVAAAMAVPALVGAALGGGLAWLVTSGRAEADTVGVILVVVGVPLIAAVVWVVVRAAKEPWDEWDDDAP